MYLLAAEKEEIMTALEKEYRHVLRLLYENENTPKEEANLRDRIRAIKGAMEKIQESIKKKKLTL